MSLKIPINKSDHHRGPLTASVNLVEYGDYECPYCAAAYPELEQVIKKYGSNICYVYRHFPLRNVHPHAVLAALSSEAADEQHRFWEMHHMLFENSDDLSEGSILEFAEVLNLDMDQFGSDLGRANLLEKVERDFTGGVRSGVNGTPTIFLNGQRYDGPPLYSALRRVLDGILGGDRWQAHR